MLRRISAYPFLLLCSTAVLLASCGAPATRADSSQTSLIEAAPSEVARHQAAYVERLRLGLGSPYRLVEIALRDDRLGAARVPVARGLLARVERGMMYDIGPLALVAAGVPEASAIAQLELMRQAIESARDPRTGELAVILAYELAAAEETVRPELVNRVARVAALLRDRELARADAARLRDAARRRGTAPEELVQSWRANRLFAVEQPTLLPLDAAAQEEAARLALLLVGGIRSAATAVNSVLQRGLAAGHDGLAPETAELLINDSIPRPSQPALLITLRALQAGAKEPRAQVNAAHWREFFERATDEERLVAALALARRSARDDVVAAGIMLDVATALRPFAQESLAVTPVTIQDLASRFGVRVRFDDQVGVVEREQALHVLATALAELRGVIRGIDLTGLTFDIGPIDSSASHLAFHEPRKRLIRLDPSTMAGTIAHELGHDLDWQLAARKYRTRSSYATDFATRNRRALARTVESLLASAAPMNQPGAADAGARRPAEIFARRFEWYVGSALALRGRSSGYLSSAQSDWIGGYGSAVRPDPAPAAAKSFADLVAEATGMDRTERAAVERTVMETAPIAVRVLTRALAAGSHAEFQRQALAELLDWSCANTWHSRMTDGAATRWYVDALAAAAFPQTVASIAPAHVSSAPFGWARGVDAVPQPGLARGSCTPFGGAFLAHSTR